MYFFVSVHIHLYRRIMFTITRGWSILQHTFRCTAQTDCEDICVVFLHSLFIVCSYIKNYTGVKGFLSALLQSSAPKVEQSLKWLLSQPDSSCFSTWADTALLDSTYCVGLPSPYKYFTISQSRSVLLTSKHLNLKCRPNFFIADQIKAFLLYWFLVIVPSFWFAIKMFPFVFLQCCVPIVFIDRKGWDMQPECIHSSSFFEPSLCSLPSAPRCPAHQLEPL